MANYPLQALLEALHQAVSKATNVAKESSLEGLREYFYEVCDDHGKPTGVYKPKTISLSLPSPEGGEIKSATYDVPLYSLVNHQSMTIEELKMDFEVELLGLNNLDKEDVKSNLMACAPGILSKKTIAKVEVTFKGGAASEGMMKINDQIIKTFPM
jgi:hypothetical protein